jgi:predicted ATPase
MSRSDSANLPFDLLERDGVLAQLRAYLNDLENGNGRVIAISGEAGIGKTSLLRAFLNEIPSTLLVLQGDCEDLSTSRPLGAVFDFAQSLDASLLASLNSEADYSHIFAKLLQAIQHCQKRIVLVIEDMHWADEATLDLVRLIGRRAARLPLLLLITHRDDEPGRGGTIARLLSGIVPQDLVRLPLSTLSETAVKGMAISAGRPASDLYKVTGGNPFFVSEVLASKSEAVPRSVRDAVWARFERCTIEQRVAIEALSVLPGGGEWDLLVQLITQPQIEQLEDLIRSGLLTAKGRLIVFRHELARQAILGLLTQSRRRNLHTAIGKWLARQDNANDLSVLAQRLHHANAADDVDTVLALAPQVAQRAAQVGAHKQAAQFLALALPFSRKQSNDVEAQLYESWSYEAGLADRIDNDVIDARHKSIALWRKCGRIDKVGLNYRWLSRLHWYRGEAKEAEHYSAQAIAVLETIEPGPELAWSYSVRS